MKIGDRVQIKKELIYEYGFDCKGKLVADSEVMRDDRISGGGSISSRGQTSWIMPMDNLEVVTTNIWKGKKR